eukprot:SAG22_NODE_751_length_7449_cov_14.062721_5_plen_162_part_00
MMLAMFRMSATYPYLLLRALHSPADGSSSFRHSSRRARSRRAAAAAHRRAVRRRRGPALAQPAPGSSAGSTGPASARTGRPAAASATRRSRGSTAAVPNPNLVAPLSFLKCRLRWTNTKHASVIRYRAWSRLLQDISIAMRHGWAINWIREIARAWVILGA